MKVASAKLTWNRSLTGEVTKQVLDYTVNGVPSSWELPSEMSEFTIERVEPFTSLSFNVTVYGADGQSTMSMGFSITAPSFEAPLPATNLGVSFFDIREEETPPPPEGVVSGMTAAARAKSGSSGAGGVKKIR
jgi:hypothetical protein